MRISGLVLLAAVASCNHGSTFVSNCTVGAPGADATLPAAAHGTTAILPGGRQVTPAGTLLDVGGVPIPLRLVPDDRYALVSDDAFQDQQLRIVDLQAADPLH